MNPPREPDGSGSDKLRVAFPKLLLQGADWSRGVTLIVHAQVGCRNHCVVYRGLHYELPPGFKGGTIRPTRFV